MTVIFTVPDLQSLETAAWMGIVLCKTRCLHKKNAKSRKFSSTGSIRRASQWEYFKRSSIVLSWEPSHAPINTIFRFERFSFQKILDILSKIAPNTLLERNLSKFSMNLKEDIEFLYCSNAFESEFSHRDNKKQDARNIWKIIFLDIKMALYLGYEKQSFQAF